MKLSAITEMDEFLPDQQCKYQFGDCGIETYRMVKRAVQRGVRDFVVVDGMVDVGDETEIPHSWVERRGKIIDPTINQFEGQEVKYSPPGTYREEFAPHEYIENFEDQYGAW